MIINILKLFGIAILISLGVFILVIMLLEMINQVKKKIRKWGVEMKKYFVIVKDNSVYEDEYESITCSFDTLQKALDFITTILSSSKCACEIYQREQVQ